MEVSYVLVILKARECAVEDCSTGTTGKFGLD
jgi:hypothetical protein